MLAADDHAPLARHPVALAALCGAGLLVVLAGAGWAWWGTDIFLSTFMAGLAVCL